MGAMGCANLSFSSMGVLRIGSRGVESGVLLIGRAICLRMIPFMLCLLGDICSRYFCAGFFDGGLVVG